MAGAGQELLRVDVPLLRGTPEQGQVFRKVAKDGSRSNAALDLGEEFPAKDHPELPHGQEESLRRSDPLRPVVGDPARGDDAVEVRGESELLVPRGEEG